MFLFIDFYFLASHIPTKVFVQSRCTINIYWVNKFYSCLCFYFYLKVHVCTDWNRVKMLDKKDICDDDVLKSLVMFGVQNIERHDLNYRIVEGPWECEKSGRISSFLPEIVGYHEQCLDTKGNSTANWGVKAEVRN